MLSLKKYSIRSFIIVCVIAAFVAPASFPLVTAQESDAVLLDISSAELTPTNRWYGGSPGRYTRSRYKSYYSSSSAVWTYAAEKDGTHDISVRGLWSYPQYYRYVVEDAPYTVSINGVQQGDIIPVDQRSLAGEWYELGAYDLNAGDEITVTLTNETSSRYYVIADSVKVELPESGSTFDPLALLPSISDFGATYNGAVYMDDGEGEAEQKRFIDIGIVYSYAALAEINGNVSVEEIAQEHIDNLNIVFANNNKLPIVTRIVGYKAAPASALQDKDTMKEALDGLYKSADVKNFRNQVAADIIVAILDSSFVDENDNYTGITRSPIKGNDPHSENTYISGVFMEYVQTNNTLIMHEISHLLGANHERDQYTAEEIESWLYPYASAYQNPEYEYATLTHGGELDGLQLVPYFSTSDITLTTEGIELPVGTEANDNARAIKEFSDTVSYYRSPISDPGLQMVQFTLGSKLFSQMVFVSGRTVQPGSWSIKDSEDNTFHNGEFQITSDGYISGTAQTPGLVKVVVTARDQNGALHEQTIFFRIVSPLQNPANPLDVDNSGYVVPLDVLLLINDLNSNGPRLVSDVDVDALLAIPRYFDVDGNGEIVPTDVLIIITYLNDLSAAENGEGEASMNDVDGDGVPNTEDNCPADANADQQDSDNDGIGDVCDETPMPEVDYVSLQSISIVDGVITIRYAKNFATCAHIRTDRGYFNQRINFICSVGEDLTASTNIANFNDPIAVGDSIKLCHGNNGNICSEFVMITE